MLPLHHKKMKTVLKMGVESNDSGKYFSTYPLGKGIKKYGVHGYGNSVKEAIEDSYSSLKEMRELAESNGDAFPDVELEFVLDVGSLFNYYPFLNMSALANKLGINASLMRKYAAGICKPSHKRTMQIQQGIRSLANEIQSVALI